MPQIMMDGGDRLVVNETEVGRSAKRPNRIEDIQLVRFYLNIARDMAKAPDESFDRVGIEGLTEEPGLGDRIFKFQIKQNHVVAGHAYVQADGKVSIPHVAADGSIGYGTGRTHGVYTVRQLATNWEVYKAAHRLDPGFRISSHPLCSSMLRAQLLPMGF